MIILPVFSFQLLWSQQKSYNKQKVGVVEKKFCRKKWSAIKLKRVSKQLSIFHFKSQTKHSIFCLILLHQKEGSQPWPNQTNYYYTPPNLILRFLLYFLNFLSNFYLITYSKLRSFKRCQHDRVWYLKMIS